MAVNHRNLYQPLIDRSLINYQIQYLARNYDFGKQSRIAALIIQEVNSGIEKVDRSLGFRRFIHFISISSGVVLRLVFLFPT